MDIINFTCNLDDDPVSFFHFWEHTAGSGHAGLALRADWQKQLERCKKELGFQHVRFHGILSDDMNTLTKQDNKQVYSFFNTDQIFDFLLSIGMRPFVELSFMPETLSSGSTTVFHYKSNVTPPADYKAWQKLIEKLVGHWMDRYGLTEVRNWFFEVWNEPNQKSFWTGTRAQYFHLYKYTAKVIKKLDAKLQVGGPATSKNAWIPEFLAYCKKNKVPVDFVSTHHYPTDPFGKAGDDTIKQLAQSHRSILRDDVMATREKAGNKPVYYTEWSTSSNPFDELHDQPYASAYIVKTIMEAHGYVEGYSYWTFSDIFEENYLSSKPFHGGFGLLNIYGIPKPAYRAFELLHKLGQYKFAVHGEHETADAWVLKNGKQVQIMITNSALPEHPVKTEIIEVKLDGLNKVKNAFVERIDDHHCNATNAWKTIGSPDNLKTEQVNELENVSLLKMDKQEVRKGKNSVFIEVEIPPQGVACVTLDLG